MLRRISPVLALVERDGRARSFRVANVTAKELSSLYWLNILSGFIIFVTAKQSGAGPLGFMRKRLIRVVPLYWVLTLFLAAVARLRRPLRHASSFCGVRPPHAEMHR